MKKIILSVALFVVSAAGLHAGGDGFRPIRAEAPRDILYGFKDGPSSRVFSERVFTESLYKLSPEARQKLYPVITESLIQDLKNEKEDIRTHAVQCLGQMDPCPKEALAPLKNALNDSKDSVRFEAALVLSQMKQKEAVTELERTLLRGEAYGANHAAFALARIGTPEAASALFKALSAESQYSRLYAAGALSKFDESPLKKEAMRNLLQAMANEKNERIQQGMGEVIQVLGPDKEIAEIAVERARQEKNQTYKWVLRSVKDKTAVPVLAAIVRNPKENQELREACARGLGGIILYNREENGTEVKWAISELIHAMKDPQLKFAAWDSLRGVQTPEAVEVSRKYSEDQEKKRRERR